MKVGDWVTYKDDLDKEKYRIYARYSKTKVSLGLKDYPDTEQDYQVDVSTLTQVKKSNQKGNVSVKGNIVTDPSGDKHLVI